MVDLEVTRVIGDEGTRDVLCIYQELDEWAELVSDANDDNFLFIRHEGDLRESRLACFLICLPDEDGG